MARTTITVQEIDSAHGGELEDLAWTAADAANNMDFANSGNEFVLIKNGHSSPLDVVFKSVVDTYGRTGDLTVSTTNAKESVAGRFPPHLWNTSGMLQIDIADDTSLSLAVVKLKN